MSRTNLVALFHSLLKKPELFALSIKENIAYGLDEEPSQEYVVVHQIAA